jgi:pyruvate/2-oxoglutarate dehydrogenase complex dihydrolipoamide acyltransferase (E2) component
MKAAALTLVAAVLFATAVLAGRWPGGTRTIAVDAVEMIGPPGAAIQRGAPTGSRPPLALDALRIVPRPVERTDLTDYDLVGAVQLAAAGATFGRAASGPGRRGAAGRLVGGSTAGASGHGVPWVAAQSGQAAGTGFGTGGDSGNGDARGDRDAGSGTASTGRPGAAPATGRHATEHRRGGRDHRGTGHGGDSTEPPTQGSSADPGTGAGSGTGSGASAGPAAGPPTWPSAWPSVAPSAWPDESSGPGRRGSSGRRTPYGR